MRLVLLTTDTTHHTYYAWKLTERVPLTAIVVETRALQPPFDTFHPFEAARDEYERDVLLAGFEGTLRDVAPAHVVETANDAAAELEALRPDLVVVFGTGKLLPRVFEIPGTACLNLHGGNPEEYRGLDTHLWAIYHRDFENLVTTLHHIDPEIDCGDIVASEPVPLRRAMPLHELRARNTDACLSLTLRAVDELKRTGDVSRRPQTRRGRYYSFMPAVLKERCVIEFERHTETL